MLLPHPDGTWVLTNDQPAMARKADPAKGEKGQYLLLSEGFDNDNDGRWNEDGTGGIVCGLNFPHRFEHWTNTGGLWAGDQPESRAILDFAFSHPDIAMILVMGSYDTLQDVPGKKSEEEKVSFRPYMAERMGISPSQEFPIVKAVQMLQGVTGNSSLDKTQARHYFGSDARTEPHPLDTVWWQQLSDDYREAVFDTITPPKSADDTKIGPGSLSEWAYFQFGVPTFAVSFWNLSAPEKAPVDSNSIDEKSMAADPITEALINFQATSKGEMPEDNWPGYISWTAASLPDGRDVLVGGEAPFSRPREGA